MLMLDAKDHFTLVWRWGALRKPNCVLGGIMRRGPTAAGVGEGENEWVLRRQH